MDEELYDTPRKFSFNIIPTHCYEHDVLNESPLGLYYNAEFKEDTKADLSKLDEIYSNSIREFTIIQCPSNLSMIKSLHYLYKTGQLSPHMFKSIDGAALEPYIDPPSSKGWNYKQIKMLFGEGILKDAPGRWLAINNMSATWTVSIAEMFCKEADWKGVLGIVFYSKPTIYNFGDCINCSKIFKVHKFPVAKI